MSLMNALRGTGGEFEVQRVLGAFGSLVYIVTGPALVWVGKVTVSFDSFCIAYPAGIAACLAATAGSIALKDRQVAKAKVDDPTFPPAKPIPGAGQ